MMGCLRGNYQACHDVRPCKCTTNAVCIILRCILEQCINKNKTRKNEIQEGSGERIADCLSALSALAARGARAASSGSRQRGGGSAGPLRLLHQPSARPLLSARISYILPQLLRRITTATRCSDERTLVLTNHAPPVSLYPE
jgi:hypothetical protein